MPNSNQFLKRKKYILIVLRPWKLNLVHNEISKLNYVFFFFLIMRWEIKKRKKRIIQIEELIFSLYPLDLGYQCSPLICLISFASSRVIICLLHSFDWVLVDELEPWPKERKKHLRNYHIEDHTDQFVNREQLKIYRKKMRGEEVRRLQSIDDYKNSI